MNNDYLKDMFVDEVKGSLNGGCSGDHITEEIVDEKILEAQLGGEVDLSDYAKKEEVTKLKEALAEKQPKGDYASTSDLNNEESARKAEIAVERERINNLTSLPEGSTTGDAELMDIRVGADGVTYNSAGEAVRSQLNNKVNKDGIGEVKIQNCEFARLNGITSNILDTTFVVGQYISINGSGQAVILGGSDKWALSDFINVDANTEYQFKIFDNYYDATVANIPTKYRMLPYAFDGNGDFIGKIEYSPENENGYDSYGGKTFTTPENTKSIRIQIYISVLSYTQMYLGKKSTFTNEYESPEGVYELPFPTYEEMEEHVDRKNFENKGYYNWLNTNCTLSASVALARQINTAKAYKMLTAKEVSLLQNDDVFQHDATLCYYDSDIMLYCFYVNNKVDKSDSAYGNNAYVRLTRLQGTVNGDSSIVENIDVCKHGDTVDGLTITSGCGVPNAIIKGNTLFMFWSARLSDDKWYELYCTYNCDTHTIGTPHRCTMGDGYFSCAKVSNLAGYESNGQISMNASIAELDGVYYACICSTADWKDGIIVKSTDLINWQYVTVPVWLGEMPSHAIFEGAMAGYEGYLFLALRQEDLDMNDDVNPMILAKMDKDGNVLENVLIPSISSRPSFFKRGTTELYLAYPTKDRTNTVCLKVENNLKDSVPYQDIPTGGNYVQVAPRTANLQYVVRTQGSTGIRVSSMNGMQKNPTDIMLDLANLLV